VVWLVRHVTTAVTTTNTITTAGTISTNSVSAFVVNTANTTITTAATIATTTTITTAANAIAAFILLMASKINDIIQIYWHRYARLILVFFKLTFMYRQFISLTYFVH
jgi:hypothetical protein